MKRTVLLVSVIAALCAGAFAQAAGGAAAKYGKVIEGSGKSAAAKTVQRKMSGALISAVNRPRTAATRKPAVQARQASGRPSTPAPSVPSAAASTYFVPDPNAKNLQTIANELGTTPQEKEQLGHLFALTKDAFEKEVSAEGRSNNIAAALTFFIAATVTVYHDANEPTDVATNALWEGLEESLSALPEMSGMSNAEKQQLYDTMIALSAVVLIGHQQAKDTGDAQSASLFRNVSGQLIRALLQVDPDTVRFTPGGLTISGTAT